MQEVGEGTADEDHAALRPRISHRAGLTSAVADIAATEVRQERHADRRVLEGSREAALGDAQRAEHPLAGQCVAGAAGHLAEQIAVGRRQGLVGPGGADEQHTQHLTALTDRTGHRGRRPHRVDAGPGLRVELHLLRVSGKILDEDGGPHQGAFDDPVRQRLQEPMEKIRAAGQIRVRVSHGDRAQLSVLVHERDDREVRAGGHEDTLADLVQGSLRVLSSGRAPWSSRAGCGCRCHAPGRVAP